MTHFCSNQPRERPFRFALVGAAFVGFLASCAHSQAQFAKMVAKNEEENERSKQEAEQELLRREKLQPFDDRKLYLWLTLTDDAARRCSLFTASPISRNSMLKEGELLPSREELIPLTVLQMNGQQGASPVGQRVVAPLSTSCAFFRSGDELAIDTLEGEHRALFRRPSGHFVRDANGDLVAIDYEPRVTETRRVTVKAGCDHMPRGEPDFFEHPRGVWVIWRPAKTPRTIKLRFDTVNIEQVCTENTY